MKTLAFITSLVLLTANTSFADCASKVERAVVREETRQMTSKNDAISFTSYAKLIKKNSKALKYQVEIFASYNDGASTDEFPSTFYEVIAVGTEENCKISSITLK